MQTNPPRTHQRTTKIGKPQNKAFNSAYVFFFILLFCLKPDIPFAQIPTGSWRTHLSYHRLQTILLAENKIYAASENGFFYLNLADNSLHTLSKEDGLSGQGITALAYAPAAGTLVLGYKDGNIDLLSSQGVANIPTLARALSFPEKEIRALAVLGDQIFLALPFGVSVVEISTQKVKETYLKIGKNGTKDPVFDLCIFADSLFLATAQGLRAASLDASVNRLDFANWRTVHQSSGIRHLTVFGEKLFFTDEKDGVFSYRNGKISPTPLPIKNTYNDLTQSENRLLLLTQDTIFVAGSDLNFTHHSGKYINNPQAAFFQKNTLWTADAMRGLVKIENSRATHFLPSGPSDLAAFKLLNIHQKLLVLAGGIAPKTDKPSGKPAAFSVFEDNSWTNYSAAHKIADAQKLPEMHDLVSASGAWAQKMYFGSQADGLLRWDMSSGNFDRLTATPLLPQTNGKGVAVSGLATDQAGTLWVSNYGVAAAAPSIHARKTDGSWQSFTFDAPATKFPAEILIDDFSQKWVRLSGKNGILVFENAHKFKILGEGVGQGDLPDASVNCLVKDRNGSIWVGTKRGVAEFFSPSEVLADVPDALLPRFEGLPLLRDENVTALAVDGGNRKWIGTENGAWLFSPDGSTLIRHFTAENSPLPASEIRSIAILPQSGEVFFATRQGVASYRSDATAAEEKYGKVKIFPNPVEPGFQGVLSISGLAQDAAVKITDLAGQLIWQTQAQGGTATWDTRDYNGKKAKAGVYLVFSLSSDGEESFAGKFALLR